MNTFYERLRQLCVSDVMHREVVEVSTSQSMAQAAKIFGDHEISGGPVVDPSGRCVGMLSAVDFMRREARLAEVAHLASCSRPAGESRLQEDESVFAYMSDAVQSVHAKASLMDAARIMCEAHIHRLPVLDAQGRAIGIVTSMDMVAAMVAGVEEHKEVNQCRSGPYDR